MFGTLRMMQRKVLTDDIRELQMELHLLKGQVRGVAGAGQDSNRVVRELKRELKAVVIDVDAIRNAVPKNVDKLRQQVSVVTLGILFIVALALPWL